MISPAILTNVALAAVIAIVSGAIGANVGMKYERSIWQQRELQREAAEKELLVKHQQEVDNLIKQHHETAVRAAREKDEAIKKLKFDYDRSRANGLRVTASICNSITGQAIADGPEGLDAGATGTVQLPEEVTGNLYAEAERADTLVEQFRALQHWLIYQGLYKE